MRAVVFGGSGFIGSHVADMLSEKGMEVTIYDICESRYLKPNQEMVVGNLKDVAKLNEVIVDQDYVINCAGIADLGEAKRNPVSATETNILGNLNILEAMRKKPPLRYVFASTYYV